MIPETVGMAVVFPSQLGPENLLIALPPSARLNPSTIFLLMRPINTYSAIVRITDIDVSVALGYQDYFTEWLRLK